MQALARGSCSELSNFNLYQIFNVNLELLSCEAKMYKTNIPPWMNGQDYRLDVIYSLYSIDKTLLPKKFHEKILKII